MSQPAAVIVLAAGEGTRMRSATPKVLHDIGGRSLLGHAMAAARGLAPRRLAVVVGHGRDRVARHVEELDPEAVVVVQEPQLGTGHATQVALQALPGLTGTVVVTYGDVPLLTTQTIAALVARHEAEGAAVTLLSAMLPDPTGYGRVLRGLDGHVVGVVEDRDASPQQRSIAEVNSGIYAFDVQVLADALTRVGADNAQREHYLTDVVAIAQADGRRVAAHLLDDARQTEGVNDRVQLARLGAELNRRVLTGWMLAGVTVVDPASTWVDVTVQLAPDVVLRPGVQLHGTTSVEELAQVGPDCTLTDVMVGAGARVVRTHGSGAVIGPAANVGPFAYLRPGTALATGGKIGTFVETKNARIAEGAKVPHLSYVGDAEIGEGTNIGAGTIVANYDGVAKHATRVGRHCRTGSNNVFVAPVEIGDGAATGAGTVVRRDVPPGALAVTSGAQRHIDDWVERKRAGTPAAEAARAARGRTGDTENSDARVTPSTDSTDDTAAESREESAP